MEWEDLVLLVEAYMEDADLGKLEDVVDTLISAGNDNENERKNAEFSIRGLLKGRDGSPFRQGVRSTHPVSVKVNIDKVAKMVYEASKVYFEMVPNGLHLKHGKSGGGGYASAHEYALNEKKKISTDLQRRFTNKKWDGTLEGLGYAPISEEE